MRVKIEYLVEAVDVRTDRPSWVVWRRVNDGEMASVGRRFPRMREVEDFVESQRTADRAAATRLGIAIDHEPISHVMTEPG